MEMVDSSHGASRGRAHSGTHACGRCVETRWIADARAVPGGKWARMCGCGRFVVIPSSKGEMYSAARCG